MKLISSDDITAAKRATLVLKAAIDNLKDVEAFKKCQADMFALTKVIRFAEAKAGE